MSDDCWRGVNVEYPFFGFKRTKASEQVSLVIQVIPPNNVGE